MNRFFVLTGGPGSGKTTLAGALEREGLHVMPEAGRTVMKARQAAGKTPRGDDPHHFADLMLALDLENLEKASRLAGPVLFDRGLPDLIGYLRLKGRAVPARLFEAAQRHRYNRVVLLAPHWAQIYTTDAQRDQSPAEAMETCRCIAAAYRELGYKTLELPRSDIVTRTTFVQHVIAGAAPIR